MQINYETICKGSYVLGTACGACSKCLKDANNLIPQYRNEIGKLRAALARTQAALDAAGELIASSFPSCTWPGRLCHNYGDVSLHTQDCEYTSKKQAYAATMNALASARGTETG